MIHDGARIGKDVRSIQLPLSCLPQDLKYNGEYAITEIGDDNDIREYVTISHEQPLEERPLLATTIF